MTASTLPPSHTTTATTIATVVTPPGRGAVAVVIVDGPNAAELIAVNFHPAFGSSFAARQVGRVVFGRWGDAITGEEVVACRKSATKAEVHCHGGNAAVARILDGLAAAGAQILDWQTWRLDTATDIIEAEADIALARATTERTALIVLDQRQGALRRAIAEAKGAIDRGEIDRAADCTSTLLDRYRLGQHLTQPWRIVLAGPPNVGKSSLINRILGYERAIVFDQPGTTRDVVTAATALEGWLCELSDTAGLRESADPLEQAGVERAKAQIAKADLLILVHELSQTPLNNSELNLLSSVSCLPPILQVVNKIDVQPGSGDNAALPAGVIATSAKTGEGIEMLARAIVAQLVDRPPIRGEAIPFTDRQAEQLRRAAAALERSDPQASRLELRCILE